MSSSPYRRVLESLSPIRQRNPRAKKHKAKPNSMEHLHPLQDSALPHSDCREVESELIRRAIGGEDSALESLFAAGRPRLRQIAMSVLGNPGDAEDAVQEGLLAAFRKLHKFEGRSRFSTWVTRIVLNAALMNRRRRNQHRHETLDEDSLYQSIRWLPHMVKLHPDPEQSLLRNERGALLRNKIRRLSPILRNTIKSRSWRAHKELARLASCGFRDHR